MQADQTLTRWSLLLMALAALTLLINLVGPLTLLVHDAPLVLTHGTEVWNSTFRSLPRLDATIILLLQIPVQLAWMWAVVQIFNLAQAYRAGAVFTLPNATRFVVIGTGLIIMSVLETLQLPLISRLLYLHHITPWQADTPWYAALQPDLIMAGAFFIILGKVMQRGCQLQELEEHTI